MASYNSSVHALQRLLSTDLSSPSAHSAVIIIKPAVSSIAAAVIASIPMSIDL
jgi:hypothetical protein